MIRNAAEAFQEVWRPRLGLETLPGVAKEHWAGVMHLIDALLQWVGMCTTHCGQLLILGRNCGNGIASSSRTPYPTATCLSERSFPKLRALLSKSERWFGGAVEFDRADQIETCMIAFQSSLE